MNQQKMGVELSFWFQRGEIIQEEVLMKLIWKYVMVGLYSGLPIRLVLGVSNEEMNLLTF